MVYGICGQVLTGDGHSPVVCLCRVLWLYDKNFLQESKTSFFFEQGCMGREHLRKSQNISENLRKTLEKIRKFKNI